MSSDFDEKRKLDLYGDDDAVAASARMITLTKTKQTRLYSIANDVLDKAWQY